MSCVEPTVEPGRERLNDGAVLADRKLLKILVVLVEGASIWDG